MVPCSGAAEFVVFADFRTLDAACRPTTAAGGAAAAVPGSAAISDTDGQIADAERPNAVLEVSAATHARPDRRAPHPKQTPARAQTGELCRVAMRILRVGVRRRKGPQDESKFGQQRRHPLQGVPAENRRSRLTQTDAHSGLPKRDCGSVGLPSDPALLPGLRSICRNSDCGGACRRCRSREMVRQGRGPDGAHRLKRKWIQARPWPSRRK